jgi:hypothetical protein
MNPTRNPSAMVTPQLGMQTPKRDLLDYITQLQTNNEELHDAERTAWAHAAIVGSQFGRLKQQINNKKNNGELSRQAFNDAAGYMSVEDALRRLEKEQESAIRSNVLTCAKEVARIRKAHLRAQEVAQQQAVRTAQAQRKEVVKSMNEAKRQAAKAEQERKKGEEQLQRAMMKAAKDAAKATKIATRTKKDATNLSSKARGSKRKRVSNDKENTPETSPKWPRTMSAPPEEPSPIKPPPQHQCSIHPTPRGLAAVQMGYGNPSPIADEEVEYTYENTAAIFPGPPPPVVHRKNNRVISEKELEVAEVLVKGF